MTQYFPADVSLRVTGEIADAQKLFPVARHLLSKAIRLKDNGLPVVRLFLPGTDGSLVHVFLHQGLKLVYIQPGTAVKVVKKVLGGLEELISIACPDVLSGIVVPGEALVVSVDPITGENTYTLHAFHPTEVSAFVYSLAFEWQDVDRLGVLSSRFSSSDNPEMQIHWPKPSMYSGAMKRVVQAIYGIGKTTITSDSPDSSEGIQEISVENLYDWRWNQTDGIHRVGETLWLVRISKELGFLLCHYHYLSVQKRKITEKRL